MQIIFNPTGTHIIRSNQLVVRFDFFATDPLSQLYKMHYVDHYDAQNKYLGKWLNPFLCHFINVSEIVKASAITDFIERKFSLNDISKLESTMILSDSGKRISRFIRARKILDNTPIKTSDIKDLIASVNSKLSMLALSLGGDIKDVPLAPQSTTVGNVPASDRTGFRTYGGYTLMDYVVSSDGSDEIDTAEVWLNSTGSTGIHFGTLDETAANQFKCREGSGDLGACAAGSRQTFTVSLTIAVGDYFASYSADGRIESDLVSGAGYRFEGNGCVTDNEQTYAAYPYQFSEGGTGAGGVALYITPSDNITISDSISKSFGAIKADNMNLSDSLNRTVNFVRSYTDTVSISDSLAKLIDLVEADSVSITESRITNYNKIPTDSIAIVDSIKKLFGIYQSDTISISDSISKGIEVSKSDILSIADSIGKSFGLSLSDSLTIIDLIIIYLVSRYKINPTEIWGTAMAKSGRYGTPPTETYGSDVAKTGRYGSP